MDESREPASPREHGEFEDPPTDVVALDDRPTGETRPALREDLATEIRPTLVPSRTRGILVSQTIVDVGVTMELPVGAVVGGDYTVLRRVMRCDVGTVYEVEQKSSGALLALKVLDRATARAASEREGFEREARLSERLAGPHTVRVVAAGADPAVDALWIATEHLVGETLAERLGRLGSGVPMEPAEAWPLLDQLCEGLAEVHQEGVVHRDVKPANIFLARGGAVTVKFLDFSAASVDDEEVARDDGALGTPLWMSPEQATGGPITPGTDVWAVGLLAFRMLTGRSYWWSARNAVVETRAFMEELLDVHLPTASERAQVLGCAQALPESFDAWFARCVNRDPRRRFRTADEMAFALHDVRSEGPRRAAAPTPAERPARQLTMPSMPIHRAPAARASQPTPEQTPAPVVLRVRTLPPGRLSSAPPSRQSTLPPPGRASSMPPSYAPPAPATRSVVSDDPLVFKAPVAAAPLRASRPARRWPPIALGAGVGVGLMVAGFALASRHGAPPQARAATQAMAAGLLPVAPAEPAAAPSAEPSAEPDLERRPSLHATIAWRPSGRRLWIGSASGDDGDWSLSLMLLRESGSRVRGYLAWTAVQAPGARGGVQVRESVEGIWRAEDGSLDLRGVTSTEPNVLPVNAYRLRVEADGALRGTSIDARTTLSAAPAP